MAEDLTGRLNDALSGRYRLEHPLGRGGMATVFLAQDLRHHRDVAIKVLHPEIAAALGPQRFQREIETLARMAHPHIVPLYDSGEASGLLYYVMPYIKGETLREQLHREGRLPLVAALRIARDVAQALEYAHHEGIIHRDIKPSNILLSDREALLSEFGISRPTHAAGADRLTSSGIVVGTPIYMSPEQTLGAATDARSDQYALACVVYEMLVGQPPFSGPTAESIARQHLAADVTPAGRLCPDVPQRVDAALLRAMSKAADDRFATVASFMEALGAESGAPSGNRPRGPRMPLRTAAVVTVAGITLIAAYLVGGRQWTLHRGPQAGADRSDHATSPPEMGTPGQTGGTALTGSRDSRARDEYARGQYYWNRRTEMDIRRAIDHFENAVALDSSYALAWVGLANSYGLLPEYSPVSRAQIMPKARDAALRALALDSTLAEAHAALGNVAKTWLRDYETAEREYRRAIALAPDYSTTHHWYAVLLAWTGRIEEARLEMERAAALEPNSMIIQLTLGRIEFLNRRYDEARAAFHRTLQLDPGRASAHAGLADTYFQQNRFREAASEWQKAFALMGDSAQIATLRRSGLPGTREEYLRARLGTALTLVPTGRATSAEIAALYAGLGDRGRAFAWLERGYQDHSLVLGDIQWLPDFAPLRGDPRYRKLLMKLELSP